ncbi:MAG: DUF4145 domain-containing protein [Hydrogenovibrio sp.]
MSKIPFTPPQANQSAFNCPICHAYSNQSWSAGFALYRNSYTEVPSVEFSYCHHCKDESVWVNGALLYPDSSQAPLANADLPDEIKNDYDEARNIINRSPRGAAALLRLCIQKLCAHLGESGKNINGDIASLVKKGLNPQVQKSLDIVRVVGNEAVHPGTIDLKDNPKIAIALCQLINIIAEQMITQPKLVAELYSQLPEEKVEQIEKRDN